MKSNPAPVPPPAHDHHNENEQVSSKCTVAPPLSPLRDIESKIIQDKQSTRPQGVLDVVSSRREYYIITAFICCGVVIDIGMLSVCKLLYCDCCELGMWFELLEPMLPWEVGGVLMLLAIEFSDVVT